MSRSEPPYSMMHLNVIPIEINVIPSNCTDYDVRLVDGDTANEGKVLLCINGVWGTLCHSSLNTIDAAVICSTAGYPNGYKINNSMCLHTLLHACRRINICYWSIF